MATKTTKIAGCIVIGLFIAIIASILSVFIYRSVISSDWYLQKRTEKSFIKMTEKVNESENISYIQIETNGGKRLVYDVPAELFDDISCPNYKTVDDLTERHRIFGGELVAVFYEDGTYTAFFITEENSLFWNDNLKIECPSLLAWYSDTVNEN